MKILSEFFLISRLLALVILSGQQEQFKRISQKFFAAFQSSGASSHNAGQGH